MKLNRTSIAAGVTLTAVALSGCSVVKGLAVAGNMNVIYLSTASTTVLLDKGYEIQTKPVCREVDKQQKSYECTGTTAAGEPIKVAVTDGTVPDPIMTIAVGTQQIFSGSASAVIAANAEVSP